MNHRLFPAEFLRLLDGETLPAIRTVRSPRPGRHLSAATGDSQEFQDFRSYMQGDDLRYLDWNIFRRSRKLFLRRYRHFPDTGHILVLDTSASVRFSWKRASTAWRLAALLGAQLLAGGDRIQLQCPGIEPGKHSYHGRDSIWDLCETLSTVWDGKADNRPPHAPRQKKAKCWVVSDFYDSEGLPELEKRLKNAAFIPVRIYDAEEYDPAFYRQSCLVDSETGTRITVAESRLLSERYLARMQDFEALLRKVGERAGGRLFRMKTSLSVNDLFENYRREFAQEGV
ncbi:MAG: hypothetical protein BWY31_04228 [Lentisphaerae bacterium ADurb.Bin242]|nr:MAG: hypothetical protein BWY31_04228 [Lentisphaerae bacterium ADurb.Bin242]